MGGAKLRRLTRRMERIREQQEPVGQTWLRCCQHRGLPSTVGLPAQENGSRNQLSYNLHSSAQPVAVFASVAAWRSGRAQLPKREVAAKHRPAGVRKFLSQRYQKRRITISAGAVGKNEAIA